MIVDCFTHVWSSSEQLGAARSVSAFHLSKGGRASAAEQREVDASPERHWRESEPVDKSFVLGFKSRYLEAEIPNETISRYVRQHPDKLIGVAGVDPTDVAEALEDVQRARGEWGLKAITLSPAAQDFHPADSRAMQVYAEAVKLKMPVFLNPGVQFSAQSKMEFARPILLDEIARELPQLKLVIAHLGFPWVDECVVLLGKHANVFADISALLHRPWQAYNALLSAHQYGVMDKLLFGSDFPYTSATGAIESLYRINQLVTGTNLPTVPRPLLAAIVEREAAQLLGVETPAVRGQRERTSLLEGQEV